MKELGSESPMESLFDIRSLEAITGGEPAALQRLLETLLASSRDARTGWRNCLHSQTCKEWPNLRTG